MDPCPDMIDRMKVAIYLRNRRLENDARYLGLIGKFVSGGCRVYEVKEDRGIEEDTGLFVSVGGDGTFLSSAAMIGDSGIPANLPGQPESESAPQESLTEAETATSEEVS